MFLPALGIRPPGCQMTTGWRHVAWCCLKSHHFPFAAWECPRAGLFKRQLLAAKDFESSSTFSRVPQKDIRFQRLHYTPCASSAGKLNLNERSAVGFPLQGVKQRDTSSLLLQASALSLLLCHGSAFTMIRCTLPWVASITILENAGKQYCMLKNCDSIQLRMVQQICLTPGKRCRQAGTWCWKPCGI